MNFIFEQICNVMIFYKCFIIVPQPCSEKLGNEAKHLTKLLISFSGQNGRCVTKAHQGLLQTKDSGYGL